MVSCMITNKHIRAARSAVGWSVKELAGKAGVGVNTLSRFEGGGDTRKSTLDKLQATLEAEGIEFLNSGHPGIRWQK